MKWKIFCDKLFIIVILSFRFPSHKLCLSAPITEAMRTHDNGKSNIMNTHIETTTFYSLAINETLGINEMLGITETLGIKEALDVDEMLNMNETLDMNETLIATFDNETATVNLTTTLGTMCQSKSDSESLDYEMWRFLQDLFHDIIELGVKGNGTNLQRNDTSMDDYGDILDSLNQYLESLIQENSTWNETRWKLTNDTGQKVNLATLVIHLSRNHSLLKQVLTFIKLTISMKGNVTVSGSECGEEFLDKVTVQPTIISVFGNGKSSILTRDISIAAGVFFLLIGLVLFIRTCRRRRRFYSTESEIGLSNLKK